MYFGTKSYLKSNHYHNVKHTKYLRVLERETKQNARNLTQEVSNCFLKNLVKLNFRPINSLFYLFNFWFVY
jgi:hypothetical protein